MSAAGHNLRNRPWCAARPTAGLHLRKQLLNNTFVIYLSLPRDGRDAGRALRRHSTIHQKASAPQPARVTCLYSLNNCAAVVAVYGEGDLRPRQRRQAPAGQGLSAIHAARAADTWQYYGNAFEALKEQRAFEKTLFNKTHRLNCAPHLFGEYFTRAAEIVTFDGITAVYRSNIDLIFYVFGAADENEVRVAIIIDDSSDIRD